MLPNGLGQLATGAEATASWAHLIECLAGQHHEVEFVEDDPGLRKVLRRALDIGWAHIHGNSLDLRGIAPVLTQRLGKGPESLRTTSLYHEEQTRVLSAQAHWSRSDAHAGRWSHQRQSVVRRSSRSWHVLVQ